MEFAHWMLADIPASLTTLAEGADGDGPAEGRIAARHAPTTAGADRMASGGGFLKDGPHGGYMGACPPWNDERVHAIASRSMRSTSTGSIFPMLFTRDDLLAAAKGHIVSSGRGGADSIRSMRRPRNDRDEMGRGRAG